MLSYPRDTTNYKIAGTATLRLASSKLLGEFGGNRQNIEKSNRSRIVADPGKMLCQVDQGGAEALVVAYCMPPGNKLRQLFLNNIKIHVYLAVVFFEQWVDRYPYVIDFRGMEIAELSKHPKWKEFKKAVADSDENEPATRFYFHYKTVGHMSNYGGAAKKLVEQMLVKSKGSVRLSLAQGEHYSAGYHSLIPEVRGFYHPWVAHQYENGGILRNLQGYPLHISQHIPETKYTEIYDKIPQSTVGTITNIAATKLQKYIEDNRLDWDFLQNNHDSYMAQAPESEIMELAKVMKGFLEADLKSPFGEIFKMRSGVQIGKNWSPRKEIKDKTGKVIDVKNPDGLIEIDI